jgi:hypothetical protein
MKTPSLNHAYRLIWSHVLNAWVAVSEVTKGHGKSRSGKRLLKRSGAASALLLSPTFTFADQTGGAVVSGSYHVGGLVGLTNNSDITNSYATGDATGNVTGDERVGGLVGWAKNSDITNSYATGDVDGYENVGGLVGKAENSKISNSYAAGSVTGEDCDEDATT